MAISADDFAWVDAYVAYGCATADDTPLLNYSGLEGVRAFSKGAKEKLDE